MDGFTFRSEVDQPALGSELTIHNVGIYFQNQHVFIIIQFYVFLFKGSCTDRCYLQTPEAADGLFAWKEAGES